jgi:CRISPR-associated protein Cas1
VGLDPYRGFYHQPRYGRPALALDLMEPFRPLIADSAVLQAINNGEIKPTDFITAGGAVALTGDGRKRFISAFERRMGHEITHPLFGYRVSYRRLLELQCRLLARHLLGEIPEYPQIITR